MYKRLYRKKEMSLLHLKPQNLAPLLGGNYQFFIYLSRGILLSFSFTVTSSPSDMYQRLFILFCHASLYFLPVSF